MLRTVLVLTISVAAGGLENASAQYGDAFEGAATLREHGCSQCHAVLGRGGGRASELTAPGSAVDSPAGFAAELWNHAPEMLSAMGSAGWERAALSRQEARSVFAFLYAVQYFEPSGDVDRGRRVFVGEQCHRCHALVRVSDGGIGPAVPDWPSLTDPVRFLEAMWNHGEAMREETRAGRLPWPTLTKRELADLLAYVYSLPELPPRPGRLEVGSPDAGMRLFDDLGCLECHAVTDTDPDLIPLAPPPGTHYTVTDLAVAMWNHQPIMQEWAEATGKEIPRLERGQMGQLLSYLMEEGYLDRRGNEKRGARLFESRGCQGCHGERGVALPERDWDAAAMVEVLWRHGPTMLDKMRDEGKRWPTLSGVDMADLIAWMNVRQ